MAKQTLLDVVKKILSTLDSDTVSSIGDTVESDQIADLVEQVYFDIIDEYQLPSQRVITTLESLSDVSKPNILKLPDNTQTLLELQYDSRLDPEDPISYKTVEYKSPTDFLRYTNARDASSTDFQVVYVELNVPIIVDTRYNPQYWTTFNDEHIVTDNVNLEVDATLQSSKTQAYLEKRWVFYKTDDFVINLPENLGSLLYRTAENTAYALFKQQVNPILQQKQERLRIRVQRNKHRSTQYENNLLNGVPNYGRK